MVSRVLEHHGSQSLHSYYLTWGIQLLSDLGYESTKADADVWICKAVKPNGQEYYEMLFVYIDNILSVSHQGKGSCPRDYELLQGKGRKHQGVNHLSWSQCIKASNAGWMQGLVYITKDLCQECEWSSAKTVG